MTRDMKMAFLEDQAMAKSIEWMESIDVLNDEKRIKKGYHLSYELIEEDGAEPTVQFHIYKLPKPFSSLAVSADFGEVNVSAVESRPKKPKTEMKQV